MGQGDDIKIQSVVIAVTLGLVVIFISFLMGEPTQKEQAGTRYNESYQTSDMSINDTKTDNLPEDTERIIDYRLGPTGSDWDELTMEERIRYKKDYLITLDEEISNVKRDYFYRAVDTTQGFHNNEGAIYGEFSSTGKLVKTYSIGHTLESAYKGERVVRVNDSRLVPDKVKQDGTQHQENDYDYYVYINEQGYLETYIVYEK